MITLKQALKIRKLAINVPADLRRAFIAREKTRVKWLKKHGLFFKEGGK